VQLPNITPTKGDLTIVYNGWYKGKIIKRIIGTSGEQIRCDATGNVFINSTAVGKIELQTASGIVLTPIKDQVIPKGRVFLHSPHPKSFDSRYQEVGLVSVSDLEGLIIAVV
jgi:conjugal transfer pilin signal peptidase TrbI